MTESSLTAYPLDISLKSFTKDATIALVLQIGSIVIAYVLLSVCWFLVNLFLVFLAQILSQLTGY